MAIFGAAKSILSPHLVDWYTDIYTNVYGYDNLYKQVLSQFNTYLKEMVNSLQFTAFTNTILTIGVVLMLFYFFTDLTEKAAMNQLSTLQLGKSFCAALGTIFIMFHSKNIFIFLMNMVESLNDSLTIGARGHMIVSNILTNDITQLLLSRCVAEHFSVWAILGYTLTALLLMLVSLAVRMYILYFATTRVLQMFIYYMFAPIGLADIFENGPGGTINTRSSGFKYLKTIIALMMQIMVITVICQVYPNITIAVNAGYFADVGDDELQKQQEEKKSNSKKDSTDKNKTEGSDDMEEDEVEKLESTAAFYPLKKFEYTDHQASIREIIVNGVNDIKESLSKLHDMLSGDEDDEKDSNEDTSQTDESAIKDDEIYPLIFDAKDDKKDNAVISNVGTIVNHDKEKEIIENSDYRMTIQSTERFFDWCTGSDGSKEMLLLILLVAKVLLISTSAQMCNSLLGTSI
ncbi:hypothetical protein LI147_13230 [Blautia wexlerae]|uniref:hypothetical protein n=1 Tax=Blautia wexlerae TaxID=418240 RepID=UPI001D06C51E|nr:hypothetical protein [Blautia wexlerae]MCB6687883.1 hypothetical protein [Blautia wexlerae]